MALKGNWVDKVNGVDDASADDINQVANAVMELEEQFKNNGNAITKETDPTVPAWAKQPNKPIYTAEEVGALPSETKIPTKISELTNDSGFITDFSESDPTVPSWAKEKQKPTYTASEVGALPADTKIPTKTSELANDSGFITKLVKDLHYYYTKDQTYTQEEINALVSAIPKFSISVVDSLPTSVISTTTVYLVKSGEGGDLYTEYIYVNGVWEILGSQRVDLTGYATEAWVGTQLSKYLLEADLSTAVNLALANAKASGEFDGEDGDPGVYVGSDTPPTGTKVQIDPEGEALEIPTMEDIERLSEEIGDKVSVNQGSENVGKILVVGTDGNLILMDMPEGGASGDVVGVLDDSNNIMLNGDIAVGTYTLMFENTDGTYTGSGVLEVRAITTEPVNLFVIGGEGYIINGRCSSTGADRPDSDGCIVSNYIDVENGDTIYIKNATILNASNGYTGIKLTGGSTIGIYPNDSEYITNYSESGGITQFTINKADADFIRICFVIDMGRTLTDDYVANEGIIITKNEPLS